MQTSTYFLRVMSYVSMLIAPVNADDSTFLIKLRSIAEGALRQLKLFSLVSALTAAAFAQVPSPGGQQPLSSIFVSEFAAAGASADTVPTSISYALPQVVFGGGWYTAIYISNPTDSPAAIQVNFNGGDGSALSVPLAGLGAVSTQTLTVNPKATVILEAPNAGPLQQGWADVQLPPGISGYGVFRQTIAGRPDQEAVVPLSPESKTTANLIWDDTFFTTGVAVVNPSGVAAAVTVAVFGDDGTQIGTGTVNLVPHGKIAFNLRDLPGLVGITGKRGLAQFTVSGGAAAVLGLRFGDSAFTSISVDYP